MMAKIILCYRCGHTKEKHVDGENCTASIGLTTWIPCGCGFYGGFVPQMRND